MAEARLPLVPLQLIDGEPEGYCDAETGVCSTPAAPSLDSPKSAEAEPAPVAYHRDDAGL